MPSQEPVTRSGITALAGVPIDVVTFWTRRGVIRPLEGPAGTGRHLRFAWYEANIAAVMAQLRLVGVPIESLVALGDYYRDAMKWSIANEISRDDAIGMRTLYNMHGMLSRKAITAEQFDERLSSERAGFGHNPPLTDRAIELHSKIPEDAFEANWLPFISISDQPQPLDFRRGPYQKDAIFWPSASGWKVSYGSFADDEAAQDGAFSYIVVNVPRTLYHVWNKR